VQHTKIKNAYQNWEKEQTPALSEGKDARNSRRACRRSIKNFLFLIEETCSIEHLSL